MMRWLIMIVLIACMAAVTMGDQIEKGAPSVDCTSIVNEGNVDTDGLSRTLEAWGRAVQDADIDALLSLVTADAEFWTDSHPPLKGRQQLRTAFEPVFTAYRMEQRFDCQELIVTGEWAFARGLEVNRLVSNESGETTEVRQRAFSVLHRGDDGTWRFARGMTNLPPE